MYHTKGYKVLCLEVKTIFGEKKTPQNPHLIQKYPKTMFNRIPDFGYALWGACSPEWEEEWTKQERRLQAQSG